MANDKKYEVVLLRGSTKFRTTVTAYDRNGAVEEAKKKMSQGYLANTESVKIIETLVNGKWVKK